MRKKSRKLRSVISSLVIFALITMMIPAGVFAEEAEAVPVEEVIVAEEVTEEAAPVAVEEEASEELVALQAEMEVAAALLPSDDTVGYFEGREYRVVYTEGNYAAALTAAETAKAHLVSINSQSEQTFIEGLLKDADGKDIIVDSWIGLANEKGNTNDWKWADGSAYSYRNFATGQDTGIAAKFIKSDESFNNKWVASKVATDTAKAYILESKEVVTTKTLILSEKEIKLGLGESKTLMATPFPEYSKLPEGAVGLEWTIECADVPAIDMSEYATVVDGKVTVTRTLPTTTTPIYVVARVVDKDGNLLPSEDKRIEGACVLKNTDAPAPAVGITFTNAKESYEVGATGKVLIATATGTNDTPRYTSSDPKIVSIGSVSGQLDLNKVGTVTITATVAGKTATCEVTVTEKPIIVDGIKITKDGKDVNGMGQAIDKGAQQQYGALVTAAGTTVTDRTVTWTSSNPALVSVDATGLVKGKVKGSAIITATVKTGEDDKDPSKVKTASMPVSVTEPVAPVEPVATTYFNNNEYQLFDATVVGGFTDAKDAAAKLNGHLVTIGSVEEQDAVASLARQGNQEYYWMGGTVAKANGKVTPTWITSEPFSYEEDWAAGEPNKVTTDNAMVMGKSGAGWYTFDGTTQNRQNVGYIVEIEDAKKPEAPQVKYDTHVQDIGWLASVKQPDPSGTVGLHKRMEAFKVTLEGAPEGLGLEYRTHVQDSGWENGYTQSPNMSGTEGNSLRMEALQLRLTGAMADQYDVYYQVHAEEFGWMPWAKNGEQSGTAGYAYQLEGIRVVVVEKDQAPPTALAPVIKTDKPFAEGPLAH